MSITSNTANSNTMVFNASLENLPAICETVTDAARQFGMDERCIWKLEVSIDEACTNIASYGYKNEDNGKIWVKWDCDGEYFTITIEDEGVQFDQTKPTTPDFEAKLCDRKPGGLGRYIMREFMDHLDYKRENNRNIVTFTKRLSDKCDCPEEPIAKSQIG